MLTAENFSEGSEAELQELADYLGKHTWKVATLDGKPRLLSRVSRRIFEESYMDYSLEGFKARLFEVTKDMQTDSIKISMETDFTKYDDRDRDYVEAKGMVVATQPMVADALAKKQEEEERNKEWKRRQIESLRKTDPDLFKD